LGRALVEASLLAGRSMAASAEAVMTALIEMARDVFSQPRDLLVFGSEGGQPIEERDNVRWERIVMPGSKGLMIRTSEEFQVVQILNTPAGLSYEGTPVSMAGAAITVMPLLTDVVEIPGESQVGWYDVETGQIEPLPAEDAQALHLAGEQQAAPQIDPAWLAKIFVTYFNDNVVARISLQTGVAYQTGSERVAWLLALVQEYATRGALLDLLMGVLAVYRQEVSDRNQPAEE
jgi:hypothetical protein